MKNLIMTTNSIATVSQNLSRSLWPYGLIALMPFLLLLINPGLFLANAFHSKVDPWIYYGYFQDLPLQLNLFSGHHAYFGDRLAFTIPGYLMNQLFSPVTADYILHFGYYYLATGTLFVLLRSVFGNRVAIITTLLFGTYYYNLWMFSWNYVDGVVNVYFLLAMLFFTRVGQGYKTRKSGFISGLFFACMLFTSINAIKLAPGMAFYFFFLLVYAWKKGEQKAPDLFLAVGFSFLGSMVGLAFFSGINFLLTGDAHVFRESIAFARWAYDYYDEVAPLNMDELYRAYWLILPLAVALIGFFTIISIAYFKKSLLNRYGLLLYGGFLVLVLPACLINTKTSQSAVFLLAPCQFSYVNAGIFLALAGILSFAKPLLTHRVTLVASGVLLIVSLVPIAMIRADGPQRGNGPEVIASAVAAIQEVDPTGNIRFILDAPYKDLTNRCGFPNFLEQGSPNDLSELFNNIASVYFWVQYDRILSFELDEINCEWARSKLHRGDRIAILSQKNSDPLTAKAALERCGLETEVVAIRQIEEGDVSFNIVFLSIP